MAEGRRDGFGNPCGFRKGNETAEITKKRENRFSCQEHARQTTTRRPIDMLMDNIVAFILAL